MLLNCRLLERLINKRLRTKGLTKQFTSEEIIDLLKKVTHGHRAYVHAKVVGQRTEFERKLAGGRHDASSIIQKLSEEFEAQWPSLRFQLNTCSGKQLVAEISRELQNSHGVSISVNMLIEEMKDSEIDPELRQVLADIEAFCRGD